MLVPKHVMRMEPFLQILHSYIHFKVLTSTTIPLKDIKITEILLLILLLTNINLLKNSGILVK